VDFDRIFVTALVVKEDKKFNNRHRRLRMNISENGIELIKAHEGLELTAYKDQGGVLTIGYGHTGQDFDENTIWTKEQCDEALMKDLVRFEECVNRLVTVEINQNQYDALCSFTYNLGCRALGNSTLLRLLNDGNSSGAAMEFKKWDHIGSKEINGLLARRNDEATLFLA
jgi:lysozyme